MEPFSKLAVVCMGFLLYQGLFPVSTLSVSESIEQYLRHFSSTRNVYKDPDLKQTTRNFIQLAFKAAGLETWTETFHSNDPKFPGVNIVGQFAGKYTGSSDDKIVLIGAHYDTVYSTPGVDDNGSGMTALLQVLKLFTNSDKQNCSRNYTLMFVAFDLEEPQPFGPGCSNQSDYSTCPCGKGDYIITYDCGSYYFVQNLSNHLNTSGSQFTGAFILDCVLNYNDTPNSQSLPTGARLLFRNIVSEVSKNKYRGDFLSLIGRSTNDGNLMSTISKHFKSSDKFKIYSVGLPVSGRPTDTVPREQLKAFSSFVESDHFRFWQSRPSLNAIHLTDSSYYRGHMRQCYHKSCDDLHHVTNDMIGFLGKTVHSLVKSAEELTHEQCTLKQMECGGEQTAESGTVKSPYFPSKYPNNILCKWTLNAPRDGMFINVSFDEFQLEDSENCTRDFLEIQEAGVNSASLAGPFCGSNKPSDVKSNSKSLKIVFQTDQLEAFRGFKVSWTTESAVVGSGNLHHPTVLSMLIGPVLFLATWFIIPF